MKKTVSFDIFDTCLCRICGEPQNLFRLLAIEVLGENASLSDIQDFQYIRIVGEQIAKKRNTIKEHVTIEEIYSECDFSTLTNINNNDILCKEISVEESQLSPINNTLDIVRKYHDAGVSILYISDMYLPESFLKEQLDRFGFYKDGDELFISGTIGKSKASGSLFKYVKRKKNTKIFNWIHYGDNKFNDFISPLKHGISAKLLNTGYSFYQKKFLEYDVKLTESPLSYVAGISRSIMLKDKFSINRLFAADFIAPLYVSFVFMVLKDAKERGIQNLYFLSRDGLIFYKIAKVMEFIFPDISLHYLYVSRKSLYLPSIEEINHSSLSNLLTIQRKEDIIDALDYLQIETSSIELSRITTKNQLIDILLNDSQLFDQLEKKRKEQYKLCFEYFTQEGLASNQNNAIVDLRGTRKCQESINYILSKENKKEVYAYYLEVTYNRLFPKKQSSYSSYLFGDILNLRTLTSNTSIIQFLLENYFSVTQDCRVASYSKKNSQIVPLYDNKEKTSERVKTISIINQSICVDFTEEFIKNRLNSFANDIFNTSYVLLSSFIRNPQKKYLYALKGVTVSDTQVKSRMLIENLTLKSVFDKNIIWWKGSGILTYGFVLTNVFCCFKKSVHICRILLKNFLPIG